MVHKLLKQYSSVSQLLLWTSYLTHGVSPNELMIWIRHKPYSDSSCFSWGCKVFSTFAVVSQWFYCHPNPEWLCFSPHHSCKNPRQNYLKLLTYTEVVRCYNRHPNPHLWENKKWSTQISQFKLILTTSEHVWERLSFAVICMHFKDELF